MDAPSPSADFDGLGDRSTALVCAALQADWVCFYRVDSQGAPHSFRPRGPPYELRRRYLAEGVERVDPLVPVQLAKLGTGYLDLEHLRYVESAQKRMYLDFLGSFGAGGAAEMVFRVKGVPVAGMSLMWLGTRSSRPPAPLVNALVSQVEFTLETLLRTRPLLSAGSPAAEGPCPLTVREEQMVLAVCEGLPNHEIAVSFGISLATVKRHLLNIFTKTGVRNRAELAARFAPLLRQS